MIPDAERLNAVPVLSPMKVDERARLVDFLKTVSYADNQEIFGDGDFGEGLYIIAEGTVVISKLYDRRRGVRRVMASMHRNASFCEMTLLDREARSVTARTKGATTVWILTRETFDEMALQAPDLRSSVILCILWAMRERLRGTSSELIALYETAPRVEKLKAIPLFAKLDEEELARVATAIEWRDVPDGEVLFKEGTVGDSMYVVESGQIEVSKVIDKEAQTEKVLAIVGEGAFFGEMSLLDNEPRSATVTARGSVHLLVIDRPTWQNLLKDSATMASKLLFGILSTTTGRLRQTSIDLVTLYDTGKMVGSITDIDELARSIINRVCEAVGADVGAMILREPYSHEVVMRYGRGLEPEFGANGLETGVVAIALLLDEAKDITDQLRDPDLAMAGLSARTLVGAPLVIPGDTIGAFLIGRSTDRPFSSDHVNLINGVSTQIAAAIENARLRAEQTARVDHERHYVHY